MSTADLTTWRKAFEGARRGEWWETDRTADMSPVVAVAPGEHVLDVEFDAGYSGTNGPEILIWTEDYVYFPVCYDGSEWLGRAPRNPQGEGQEHVGGG